MPGISIRNFSDALAGAGVFYNGGVPYDVDGALCVGNLDSLNRLPRNPGGVWCSWQTASGTLSMVSTDAGDDIALDTSTLMDGVAMAKCTFSNAVSGTFIAKYVFTNPVSLANFKTIQVPVQITSNESASGVGQNTATFNVWLYPSGGGTIRLSCDFANIPPSGRHVFTFSRESTTGLVAFSGTSAANWSILDTETISEVRIVQGTIAASVGYPVWVGQLRTNGRAQQGFLSIVMDGEYSSQYSLIKPILDRYAFKSSLAIVNSDIGGTGRMTLAQLSEMYDQGHECVHHTYDGTKTSGYASAADWATSAAISADINAQWAYFRTQGWTRGIGKAVNAFTNPFANSVAGTRQNLILDAFNASGVQCSRTSTNLYTAQMDIGYNGVQPFHLRGAVQITNTTTAADINTIIDQAANNSEWAIITIHRAVASSPGALEMTTANFETWLAYLATVVAAGNVSVAPMGEVWDRYFS